jgi:hypothetical protein
MEQYYKVLNQHLEIFMWLYTELPSAMMGSYAGGWAVQLPAESFMCLLSDAKKRRKIGACTIRKDLIPRKTFCYIEIIS